MKSRGLLIMVAVTAVAVGYAVYDFQREKTATAKKDADAVIVPWDVETIQEIEVTSIDNRNVTTRLKKDDSGWRVVEPLMDLADANELRDFLQGLAKEKTVETVGETGPIDWKIFGLEEPRGKIHLRRVSGEELTLAISTKKNFQGDAFMRVNRNEEVLAVSSSWFARLEKRPIDFRDKRVLRWPLADLTAVAVKGRNGVFTMEQKDGKWVAREHSGWSLDQNKAREFIQDLGKPMVSEFLVERPKGVFEKPALEIALSFKDGKTWKGMIGENKEKESFVTATEPAIIGRMTSAEAERLGAITLAQLRNRSEPFDFPKQDVKKIELRTSLKTTDLELKGEKWEIARKDDGALGVEGAKVDSLLGKLRELKVTEFIDKKMSLPGAPKAVFLKDGTGKLLFELSLGEIQKKKIDGADKVVYLAKTNLFPELITIEEGMINGLGIEDMLVDAAKAAGGKETKK